MCPMPNGHDKMLRRLQACCGVYHDRYGSWPTQARFEPQALHVIAWLLAPEDFETLARKLELRTSTTILSISVGGVGVVPQ